VTVARHLARLPLGLLLLQVSRIQHDQFGQLAAGGGGDDLARETLFRQQGNTAAVVEVGMGEQQIIHRRGIETEGLVIFLRQFASALIQPAVDQNLLAAAAHQMAGSGNVVIGAVKGYFHRLLLVVVQ
jgi:hypothetical protein